MNLVETLNRARHLAGMSPLSEAKVLELLKEDEASDGAAKKAVYKYAYQAAKTLDETEVNLATDLGGGKLDVGRKHPQFDSKFAEACKSASIAADRWYQAAKKNPKHATVLDQYFPTLIKAIEKGPGTIKSFITNNALGE